MTIVIGDNSPRKTYTGNGSTTEFATDFAFFDKSDVNVYVDGTLKTLNTDYTIPTTGANAWSTGNDGTVVFTTAPANNASVVLTRDVELERTTDFPSSGPFQVATLNTELDKIVAMIADLEDLASRGITLADSDTGDTASLPNVTDRKGRVLAFENDSTAAPKAGPLITDVQLVADVSADIATLADIEDGTDATDAIQTVAGISANVTTVADNDTNVTTVAGQTTNMQNVTDNLSAIQNAATNATTASTKATEAATSATNAATSATAASTAQTAAETAQTAAETAQTAAETAQTAAETAETNAETAQTAAETAQTAAETAETNAATSETNAATSASTATTKATEAATSATNAATSETNAATSATNAATSATAASNSQVAAAASAASAATALDNFDDTYLGSKASDPTVDNDGDALTTGDLYFNTTDNEMRVYDGANWIAASSAGGASLLNYNYTATAGQTTFSGADDNSATLSYTTSNIIVTLNGVVLEDGTDYTASDGTSVVLTEGANVDDELNIVAFKSFTTADMVSATTGGTFNGNVTIDADLTMTGNIVDLTTTAINGGQVGGRRNFIYNGAMTVWQRGTSDDTASNNDYMCDRWQIGFTGLDGNVDWDRSTDTPDGFSYSLKVSMDASETSLDAADRIHIQQKFEGQDLQHLRYGSSGAKTCTVSFWVKSSVAGTYTLNVFQNEAVTNRQISKSYTIDTADTWEHKTITFAGDTSTAINNDDAEGLRLGWWLDAGSNFTSGTFATDWEDYTAANRVHSTTGWLESTSPEFYITGVQLEVGSTATEFEYRGFGDELALCQRYCVKLKSHRANPQLFGRGWDSDSAQITLSFPVLMRGEDFQYQGTGSFTKHGDVAINAYASNGNNVTAIGNWVVVGTQVVSVLDTSASVSGGSTVWWSMADDAYFLLENEL